MTERLRALYDSVIQKEHHIHRKPFEENLCQRYAAQGLSPTRRVADRLSRLLAAEVPVLLPGERIALLRTVSTLPALFTDAEMSDIRARHFLHEQGVVCNVCPGYADVIATGLEPVLKLATERAAAEDCAAGDNPALPGEDATGEYAERREFYRAVAVSVEAVLALCDRYQAAAEAAGNREVAALLRRVPRQGAESFHEALQSLRVLHYTLWLEGEYHNTLGRFDQYMYPYYQNDIAKGRLTQEEAYELLLEFFLSFNRDSDLYPGVQQGDNGQSLVLGGRTPEGNDGFNELSALCLRASKALLLIDPKINVRVHADTDPEVYRLGTELTREGLGFPQYSNDDIVIPGLIALGYDPKDAQNYAVAACWEFIIPKVGMDIPNIGALNFPKVVNRCVEASLGDCADFDALFRRVQAAIVQACDEILGEIHDLYMFPAPFLSVLMDDCLQRGRDISQGGTYNNFGLHGTGLSNAADSLAAIQKHVFAEKTVSPAELLAALRENFEEHDELLHRLRYESPKMGNDEDDADEIASALLAAFAKALRGRKNERGGCIRAGTGSAMYYLWHAGETGASADGRRRGEAFGANYAPSLFAKIKGPFSVIRSFTKPRLIDAINGGPLTMEFHDSLFASPESEKKVAELVRSYIALGGHQMQLNALRPERLREAQAHPEAHRRLIVRVWGWSAYFVELDREYQEHVLSRQTYRT